MILHPFGWKESNIHTVKNWWRRQLFAQKLLKQQRRFFCTLCINLVFDVKIDRHRWIETFVSFWWKSGTCWDDVASVDGSNCEYYKEYYGWELACLMSMCQHTNLSQTKAWGAITFRRTYTCKARSDNLCIEEANFLLFVFIRMRICLLTLGQNKRNSLRNICTKNKVVPVCNCIFKIFIIIFAVILSRMCFQTSAFDSKW